MTSKIFFWLPDGINAKPNKLYVFGRDEANCVKRFIIQYVGQLAIRRIHLRKAHESFGASIATLHAYDSAQLFLSQRIALL